MSMKLLHLLALAALIALPATLPAAAQDDTPPPPRPVLDAPTQAPVAPKRDTPLTRSLAGPYLAGRVAATDNAFEAASDYYLRALETDRNSPFLNDSTLISLVAAGRVDRAIALVDQFAAEGAGAKSPIARLIQRARLAEEQDWDALLAVIEAERSKGEQQEKLLDGMLRAWALLGAGRAAEADAAFVETAKIRGVETLVGYHRALSKALVGDLEAAAGLLAGDSAEQSLVGLIAHAEILALLDRRDEAIALLEQVQQEGLDDIAGEKLALLRSGEPVQFDVVSGPRDGIAQVFLTFATLLSNDVDPGPLALVHARLASHIAPDIADARLMVAQMLQLAGQFDAAEAQFDRLRESGDMRPLAELVRIDTLARAGRIEDAERAARTLTEARPQIAQGWIALGDLLRQQDRWAEAVAPYDRAIALIDPADTDSLWFPLYARAIAFERSGNFERAETDLKAALEIRPDNAQMLNYLGYSYVDRGENLDLALRLIEQAVELSPDDGYILDSLGWVLYRLGRYQEAVEPQERALAQMSNDPLVNDHMGDIYWKVGRKREARMQWQRALSFKPETEDEAYRIRAKLDRGLDAVLEEEAANGGKLPPPPAVPEETSADATPADATPENAATRDAATGDDATGDDADLPPAE
ncbi:hypothetical protein CYR75_11070 [Paracoccus jeotgali]|uniref:Uncharacterized protein n=2 Tax=Paracoccus jeotgali TaxID=2065379 RepID=A0A2K9MJ57_9RHOB|nr:hypothetical protein CYR75_11070 [Paracoccus jeotgali]